MDEKPSETEKPKVTRSRARHIRRKRLLSARRAAGDEPSGAKLTIDESENRNTPLNHTNECLSKSKARRLRKKKKNCSDTVKNSDNLPEIEKSSRMKDIAKDVEESTTSLTISKIEKKIPPLSDDDDEPEDITRESTATRTTVSEHELFENEKNLKITENSRNSPESHILIDEDYESGVITLIERTNACSELIINDDTLSRVSVECDTFYEPIFVSNVDNNRCEGSSLISEPRILSFDETIAASDELANSMMDKTSISKNHDNNERTMYLSEKTRDQVKAEREAKKAAKAAAKSKTKNSKLQTNDDASSTKIGDDVPTKKIERAPRGDVVDGEISIMQSKPTTISTNKEKPLILPTSVKTDEVKSKSELRNERRAKQEAQRAAKQAQTTVKKAQIVEKPVMANAKIEVKLVTNKIDDSPKKIVKRCIAKENSHEVNLFKHLYHEREQSMIRMPIVNSNIHPAIVRLGVQYSDKVIVGSNARCVALLAAVKRLIEDFERPSQADFTRGLETCLQESSAYLHHCRPLAVSMQNALKHLKWQMTQLTSTTSDEEAKTKLGNAIDTYIREQIQLADKAISITIQTKISNGDVILTYGYSSLINKILCDAHDAGRQFRVVIVDGRPWLEGREQLRRLAKHGLECSYVLINALSFIMPEVSKVFLGAHAILANGAVMSRVGTAQVALMAKSFNVPVLVACETHKTCERVQTDSIVYNEIGDADELAQNSMGGSKKTSLINWRSRKSLNLLNITYDVTPADLVTAVVTELAILPCTSVPVILRIKPSEI